MKRNINMLIDRDSKKTWEEDEFVSLSMLSQYGYCKRRAFLLLSGIENIVNSDVAEGIIQHNNVHSKHEKKGNEMRICYDMPVHSNKYGLTGKCDMVEIYNSGEVIPIEYKHGVTRDEIEYEYQLCAQALCLEEIFDVEIKKGFIFYIDSHRRKEVILGNELRKETINISKEIRSLQKNIMKSIIPAMYSSKCKKCSMLDECMPKMKKSTDSYINKMWEVFMHDN